MRRLKYLVLAGIASILVLLGPMPAPLSAAGLRDRGSLAQEPPGDRVTQLMARMPLEVKIGQLFLVTFPGDEVAPDSGIYQLIHDYYVGGVLLSAQNGNITNGVGGPTQAFSLTSALQNEVWQVAQLPMDATPDTGTEVRLPTYAPLFVAVAHEGDGLPYTSLVEGFTPVPSEMAIGATWDPAQAEAVGEIVGQELSAVGFNMLLGPGLDVVDTVPSTGSSDLTVRSFGGDPFWVGQMGTAYIRGVHHGSAGQMVTVASHFPGLGSADRPLEDEVSTVPKSLEQLKQIELAPFFAAAAAEDPMARTDAILVSHVRYRGFQGNIYASTKPISFDAQAMQQLMALPELAEWRANGGLTVSDSLGVRAVRRFYDPTGQTFYARRIAKEALMAGNDVLLLSQFTGSGEWDDHFSNIRTTIDFFIEEYQRDATFQARVDDAVRRILQMKLRLYPDFNLRPVQLENDVEQRVGHSAEVVTNIARQGITLITPPSSDLLPPPPAEGDNIVIFTDERQLLPCSGCEAVPAIGPDQLATTLLRLYGPRATGQLRESQLSSFGFSALRNYLEGVPEGDTSAAAAEARAVEPALAQADWVVFAMLDTSPSYTSSGIVKQFLAERVDALRTRRVIVLAYGAPYYLDTTEISKLTAYYVMYSRVTPFVNASLRALFGEFAPVGAPPVDVPGIDYDLFLQTQPDPAQIITINYGQAVTPTVDATPAPLDLQVGDTLTLTTSVIRDHNGHPVPDNTPVEFMFSYPLEGLRADSKLAMTHQGVATTSLVLDRAAQLEITVKSDPVQPAYRLQVTIQEDAPAVIVPVLPTPQPSPIPTVTPTPGATSTPTLEPTPERLVPPESKVPPGGRLGLADLLLALAAAGLVGGTAFYLSYQRWRHSSKSLRLSLLCVSSGLGSYVVLAAAAHLSKTANVAATTPCVGLISMCGSLLPVGVGWIVWGRRRREERTGQSVLQKS